MPYIDKGRRAHFEPELGDLLRSMSVDGCAPGDLNYLVTRIVRHYVRLKGKSYTHINDAVGVLECAKLELYRRLAAPYEDTKIAENGDVE